MPNIKGLTGDLELPDWPNGWTYSEADESLRCSDGAGDFDAIMWSHHSSFAMICAMLWRMESDRLLDEHNRAINCGLASDLIAVGFHAAYDKCLAWEKEATARLEAERKVG